MAHVKIPHEHFIKSAKTQYADHEMAIFREAVQNSVDAGATTIAITVTPRTVVVDDNGCGMNRQILEDAMLTMSGTFKREGSIGGFGAAKELLLFQHASYELWTRDVMVHGSALTYEMEPATYREGTILNMVFHDSYNFNKETMIAKCITFLSECQFRGVTVTLNGESYEGLNVTTEVKDLEWGKIYCDTIDGSRDCAVIRINGVKMFTAYVGSMNKAIVIEITKPSTEILTGNRDGFVWHIGREVEKIISEMTINKDSFGRLHNTISKFKGANKTFIVNVVQRIKNLIKDIDETLLVFGKSRPAAVEMFDDIAEKVNTGAMTQEEAVQIINEGVKELDHSIKINVENVIAHGNKVDFYVQINDKGYDKIPAGISPGTMKKKYLTIAKEWKAALTHVAQATYRSQAFAIGFVIDENVCAQFMRKDDVVVYMINPFKYEKMDKNRRSYAILGAAAHEMTHNVYPYHDENFVKCSENFMQEALAYGFTPRKIQLQAKQEII